MFIFMRSPLEMDRVQTDEARGNEEKEQKKKTWGRASKHAGDEDRTGTEGGVRQKKC